MYATGMLFFCLCVWLFSLLLAFDDLCTLKCVAEYVNLLIFSLCNWSWYSRLAVVTSYLTLITWLSKKVGGVQIVSI